MAVIDIGSNSGRVVVYEIDEHGMLRIRASTRAPLRLVEGVEDGRELSAPVVERALEALADFRAVAVGSGARRIVAVATAAMRDAANGGELIERVRRELDVDVAVIDGASEARYGFLGAVHSLPVDEGLLFDLGGGSLQVSQFRRRRPGRNWSLPLGALRLSHRFLQSDPPSVSELRRLKEYVHQELLRAGLPRLGEGERLVGTGGTLRNLAKVDRRAREYPIERVHGYSLGRKRVREMASTLSEKRQARRASTPGLSDARADSVVGGAVAIETLMDTVGASRVVVSGEGVREGLAYSLLAPGLPAVQQVREASIASLAARFADWSSERAESRRELAATLHRTLDRAAPPDVKEALLHAAVLLDLGRSVDFFDRHEHAADIVLATDLNGFSHRDTALLAGVLLAAGDETGAVKALSPLVKERDRPFVVRAGVILALVDDLLERSRPDRQPRVSCRVRDRDVVIRAPTLLAWRPRGIGERFQHAFGRRLDVRAGSA